MSDDPLSDDEETEVVEFVPGNSQWIKELRLDQMIRDDGLTAVALTLTFADGRSQEIYLTPATVRWLAKTLPLLARSLGDA